MKKKTRFSLEGLVGPVGGGVRDQYGEQTCGQLIAAAAQRREDYDFEAAVELLRLAALKSGGELEHVEPLLQFLTEELGGFAEVAAILENSPWLDQPKARKYLLLALRSEGRFEAAAALLEGFPASHPDLEVWKTAAEVMEKLGRYQAVCQLSTRALAIDPASIPMLEVRKKAEAALEEQLAGVRAELDRLLNQGSLDEAEAILNRYRSDCAPPSFGGLRKRLATLRVAKALETALESGLNAEQAGDLSGAVEAFNRALELDPECFSAREKVATLQQRRREAEAAAFMAGARETLAQDPVRALEQLHRGLKSGAERPGKDSPRLFSLFLSWLDAGNANPGREEYLALVELDRLLSGRETDGRAAGDAKYGKLPALRRVLGDFGPMLRLAQEADLELREKKLAQARALVAEAEAKADEAGLVAAMRQAVQLAPELEGELALRLVRLEKKLQAREAMEKGLAELKSLYERRRWFALLAFLENNPMLAAFFPDAANWKAEAQKIVELDFAFEVSEMSYPAHESPCRLSSKEQLDQELPGGRTMVFSGLQRDRVLLVNGRDAILLEPSSCRAVCKARLPEAAGFVAGKNLLLHSSGPDRDFFCTVYPDEDRFCFFVLKGDGLETRNVGGLKQHFGLSRAAMRSFHLNGETLVVAEHADRPDSETLVRGLLLTEEKVVFESRQPFPLHQLTAIPGRETLRVNRGFDPIAFQRRSWFSWAQTDLRGRLQGKHFIAPEQVDGAILEGVISMEFSAGQDMFYFFARYLEPLSGQVITTPPAFVAMRGDGTIYYSVADGNALLRRRDAEVLGGLHLHGSGEAQVLVVPSRGDRGLELSTFSAADLSPKWVLSADSAQSVRAFSSSDGKRLWLLCFFEQGRLFSVREVDAEKGRFLS